jgi:hypothetical protein|tara:strand:- start:10600 stop:11268 length:669 start_codon:yes stop_codon:yes gene_type:complete
MIINFHDLMAFFHVVLFVYAIGGDIAVYFIGNYITREELTIEERLRVRSMRFLVDMSARTSLVLLLPIGFTLATTFGSEIKGTALTSIWLFSIVWLGLIWMVHFKKETVTGELLRKLDLLIRYILSFLLIALGIFCLTTNNIIQSDWLSWKIIIFGLILVNGIWIRAIVGRMRKSIQLVQESDTKIEGEKSIKKDQAVLNKAALLIWVLVILMAFLGELKPL